jgi:uncharacterized hydrophobic protein (TIGR00271 family)
MEAALFLDRSDAAYKVQRFGLLLVLSALIASGGIITDSTATVIGAMLVAPLAVPIMGVALATVVGSGRRLTRAVLGVVGGALGAALIGAMMTVFVPNGTDLLTNGQVTGRVSPSVVDMVVALAVGFVSAVGTMRKDVSSVLPGVAIAISLVPPMCVVGIMAAEGYYNDALGALTLFATNVIAMITAGILTFAIAHYARQGHTPRDLRSHRVVAVVVGSLLVLLIPLTVQSLAFVRESDTRAGTISAAQEWVDGTGWVFTDVEFLPDKIVVKILGTGVPPDTDTLMRMLAERVPSHYRVEVDVEEGRTLRPGTIGEQ